MPLYVVSSLSLFGSVVNAVHTHVLHPLPSTPYISALKEETEHSLFSPFINLLLNFLSLTLSDLNPFDTPALLTMIAVEQESWMQCIHSANTGY